MEVFKNGFKGNISMIRLTTNIDCLDVKSGVYVAGGTSLNSSAKQAGWPKVSTTLFGLVSYDKTTGESVVICKPETGRTHQIRVQLEYLGYRCLGDECYGGGEVPATSEGGVLKGSEKGGGGGEGRSYLDSVGEDEVEACGEGEGGEGGGDGGGGGGGGEDDSTIEGLTALVSATCVFCRRGLNDEKKAVEGYESHTKGICLHAWRFRAKGVGLDVTSELPHWAMTPGGP